MTSRESTGTAFELGRDLGRAIDAREMEAWFQPQVGTGEQVTGFEALLRWNHPVHGLIPPARFIPLAEATGLIGILGSWITSEACRCCTGWTRAGDRGLGVAINASAIQLEQADFADHIAAIVSSTGVDPTRVMIEITETAFIKNMEGAAEHVRALSAMGMHVALDDFGSGYATFTCLASLPIDTVKLDSAFVSRTIANKPAMLNSIVRMAHENGFCVIAEGVETEEQSNFLRNAGCDRLQGFYYGHPMPGAAVMPFIERCLAVSPTVQSRPAVRG
jgi:EAL domain-containing protein (putative c-di-GMP-specific phosphodiesterase class I)